MCGGTSAINEWNEHDLITKGTKQGKAEKGNEEKCKAKAHATIPPRVPDEVLNRYTLGRVFTLRHHAAAPNRAHQREQAFPATHTDRLNFLRFLAPVECLRRLFPTAEGCC